MKECPCHFCEKREVGCNCQEYKSWKKEKEELNKKLATQKVYDSWQLEDKQKRR